MGNKCVICGESTGLFQKYIIYPGREKGALEITSGQPICNKCQKNRSDSDPKDFASIFLLMQNGKAQEALDKLMEIYNPNSSTNNYNVGNILSNLHRFDEALEYYDTALFLDTHYVKAWYRKGALLFSTDRFPDATKCFENIIELNSQNATVWALPACFYRMLCLIQMHNSALNSDNSSHLSEAINQHIIDLYPIILQISGFEKEAGELILMINNGQVPAFINGFVDFCFEYYNEILDFIEPNEAIHVREPERTWFFQK